MADDLTFLMGKFPALIPGKLLYAGRNHVWCQVDGDRLRFGFTTYAVRLMQDVFFLEWRVDVGARVEPLQEIGFIETSKATSGLYAPVPGTITAFNPGLLQDPSGINVDPHAAWLYEMQAVPDGLLSAAAYHQYLTDNWDKTQAHIKGKLNTDS